MRLCKCSASETPRKAYLGYDEPYDRSLVRVTHEHGSIEGWLSFELPKGEVHTFMMDQTEGDLDKLHQALWSAVKFKRQYGFTKHLSLSNFSGISVMLQS